MPSIFDHVDARVRDRAAATAFYDAFLTILGAVKREGAEWTTWRIPPRGGALDVAPDNFGIIEEREHVPGAMRIAFKAPSRGAVDEVAACLRALGVAIEMDDGIYGDDFYGVFFEDPDGNRLEVCISRSTGDPQL
jgi:catechol 2,3-dioxygenase-like lactoylglutathione lyase family enzyme